MMNKKDITPQSRRSWMRMTGLWAMGISAGGNLAAIPSCERSKLTYRSVLAAAPWSSRYGLAAVVFRNKLWVLGGTGTLNNGDQFNDVWSSSDGINWRQELASAPWKPRWGHAVFAFKDKIWVIGGLSSVDPLHNLNDIWSSSDGVSWNLEVENAPWVGRHVWAWTTHQDRMYLIGGATDGSRSYQDVISSGDGIHWRNEIVQNTWFPERKYHAVTSYRGNLFVVAGINTQLLQDVWSSKNGSAWHSVGSLSIPWGARLGHSLIVYRDKLWLIGGGTRGNSFLLDMWTSEDGKSWYMQTDRFAWPGRYHPGIIVFKDKVWVLGGTSDSIGKTSLNDIWVFECEE